MTKYERKSKDRSSTSKRIGKRPPEQRTPSPIVPPEGRKYGKSKGRSGPRGG